MRQGGGDIDDFSAHGVGEGDAVALQADATVGVAALGSVLEVALDGAANGGELAADLMLAAGDEVHFEQMVAVGAGQQSVVEHSFHRSLARMQAGVGFVVLFHAGEPVGECGAVVRRPVLDDGPVGFVDLTAAEELVHASEPLAGACQHHQPAGGPVDAVREAAEHVAGLVVFFFYPLPDDVHQGHVACAVALHELADGLVDDDDVIVFVNDVHNTLLYYI